MKKTTRIIAYSQFSFAVISAVVAIVFLASALTAHAATPRFGAACYSVPATVRVGETVTWVSNVVGGSLTKPDIYTWSGTDGLLGNGSTQTKVYYTPGYKSANLKVTSGAHDTRVTCANSVNVLPVNTPTNTPPPSGGGSGTGTGSGTGSVINNNYNTNTNTNNNGGSVPNGSSGYYSSYGYYYPAPTTYVYPQPTTYTYPYNYNNGYGNGYYDNSYYDTSAYNQYPYNYNTGYTNSYPQYVSSNSSGLDIGCYADPVTASINQPVTWNVEVTGGSAPYRYSWTGSDGLSSTQSSVVKYYNTSGEKNAIVTVTSADGRTGTRACTNALTVRGAGTTYRAPVQTPVQPQTQNPQQNQNGNGLSAASAFSLGNIPWGWIAVLIILVLFFTVLYLLFNRQKI